MPQCQSIIFGDTALSPDQGNPFRVSRYHPVGFRPGLASLILYSVRTGARGAPQKFPAPHRGVGRGIDFFAPRPILLDKRGRSSRVPVKSPFRGPGVTVNSLGSLLLWDLARNLEWLPKPTGCSRVTRKALAASSVCSRFTFMTGIR